MTGRTRPSSLILGIATVTRGFGWVAFDSPFNAYDWNLVFVRSDKNVRCIRQFERLLDRLEPDLIVIEDSPAKAVRSRRMTALHRLLKASAALRDIEVAVYARGDVQSCFATVGARTNQEIAEAVARQVQGLALKLPRKRHAWTGEDRRLALFGAAALVMTHFHHGGKEFLQGLKSAA